MKKIGKNTKLYLIGMIIGGITLGITTVIADTIINSTSVAYKTTTVKAALDELYDIADFKQEVKDMLYPVGSIYISVSSTNPSQLFGGTWVSFGMGRTLVGTGSTVLNTETGHGTVTEGSGIAGVSEQMGGEYYHTLTVDEMPSHQHWLAVAGWNSGRIEYRLLNGSALDGNEGWRVRGDVEFNWEGNNGNGSGWGLALPEGGSTAHNNIQPYITVYMWKRTG